MIIFREEKTMDEAIREIRSHGPQPPLHWWHPVLLGIAFLAGVLIGLGLERLH